MRFLRWFHIILEDFIENYDYHRYEKQLSSWESFKRARPYFKNYFDVRFRPPRRK